MKRLGFDLGRVVQLLALLSVATVLRAQTPEAAAPAPAAAEAKFSGTIAGTVKSGDLRIPGVSVTAYHPASRKRYVTSTDADGLYTISVPEPGQYFVRAEMLAFARSIVEINFAADKSGTKQKADFTLTLASRAQQADPTGGALAGLGVEQGGGAGLQALFGGATENLGTDAAQVAGGGTSITGAAMPSLPFAGADSATESFSYTGATANTNDAGLDPERLRERIQEMRDRGEIPGGGQGPLGGGGGFGGGGFGGGPGGGGPGVFRIPRRFNINQPHGMIFYEAGNAALDARAYSLTGVPAEKPDYSRNRIGAILGGPLKIPHLLDASKTTFYFLNYFGTISRNPFDVFGTVPTLAERSGDFSASVIQGGPNAGKPVRVLDPLTGLPFAQNKIPANRINAAAAGLLAFIPQPNQPGTVQNFHRVASAADRSQNINFRIQHSLDPAGDTNQTNQNRTGNANGGAGGRGRGAGGGGGPFAALRSRNNIGFNFNYRKSSSDLVNFSSSLGGKSSGEGINAGVNYTRSFGAWQNRANVNLNLNRVNTGNFLAGVRDIEGDLGILGVSTDPLDFGVPSLSFTHFSGLSDVTPRLRHDMTWQLGDVLSWNRKKRNLRFGGDFRRILQNVRANVNPRGTFVFTGLRTAQGGGGVPVADAGYDFADFLLGLPQQTSIQFSANTFYFRGNSWDVYAQDDWRALAKLTISLGLRYEYISPFSEKQNRLVNLDVNGGFTSAAAVKPGQAGPFNGAFPPGLVNPDRNNFAPRIGIAWRARNKMIVRTGYGVSYNTGVYGSFVQQLAYQPPFSVTQTNVNGAVTPLTLQSGFPQQVSTLTNNFGVDLNYRLGYVQTWNLNVQQELPAGLVMNVGYTGTKGTGLDVVRAPNRGPAGPRIPGVQAFLWQNSQASSILHSGTASLRKRLRHGVSVAGTYTFAKSIDNASSIGGGATVVAQNDQDLAAERALSSFDQRHRFNVNSVFEFPFGPNRRWLSHGGTASKVLNDWTWNVSFTAASGVHFTPRVLGSASDVNNGVNGTLRASATGQQVDIGDRTTALFFNTAAFTLPMAGTFGNAGRNTIQGPGTLSFDSSIGKTISIKDAQQLELRVQASNVLNYPNFSGIDTVVNSPGFGRVSSVAQMRQLQLVARFRF